MGELQAATSQPDPHARGGRLPFGVVLGLLLVVALGLRLAVSHRAVWYDEAFTYWEAQGSPLSVRTVSFSRLPSLTVSVLPDGWDSPWHLRLPFLVLGLGSVAAFAAAVRRRDGDRLGLLTALLLAVSPYHVLYSTEARMYAWAQLAAGLSFLCLVVLLHRPRRLLWLGYAVASAVGVWAHPFFATLVVAQGGFLAVTRRDLLRRWLTAAVAAAVLSSPALWHGVFVHGVGTTVLGWIHARPLLALPATFYGFVLGNAFVPSAAWWLLAAFTLAAVAGLAVVGVVTKRPWASLVTWSLVAPIALIVAASVFVDLYSEQSIRYLAFAQPFLIILVARGLVSLRSPWRRVTATVAVTAMLVAGLAPLALWWEREGMGAHDAVADTLRDRLAAGDVIVAEGLVGVPLAYYLRHAPSVRQVVIGKGDPIPDVGSATRVWFVGMENLTMTTYLRAGGRSRMAPPPPLPGFVPASQLLFPGRKPITVTLFERDGERLPDLVQSDGGRGARSAQGRQLRLAARRVLRVVA